MFNFLNLLFVTFFFIFGALVGSFLNVVALRFNTGKSITNGRSECFSCRKKLSWYELIPLFSYFFQKGKCTSCKSKVSFQYPLVEFLTGLIFVAVALKFCVVNNFGIYFNLYQVISYFILFSILIVIAIYDIRHKIIPDSLSYSFALISLFKMIYEYRGLLLTYPHILDLLAGPILALPFVFFWFISKGEWMGFGDAKLAVGIGWFFGLTQGMTSIAFGFWIGAGVSLLLMLLERIRCYMSGKKATLLLKSEIPFAPYLILGLITVFFFSVDIFSYLFLFW